MKSKKRRKELEVYCPYCGKKAVMVKQKDVYGLKAKAPEENAWICRDFFNGCDALVTTYKGTAKPKGHLANTSLRKKRVVAHEAINQVIRAGIMDFHSIYDYIEERFGMRKGSFHIGESGDYYCEKVIQLMDELLENNKRRQKGGK